MYCPASAAESLPLDLVESDRIKNGTVDMGAYEGAVAGGGITVNPGFEDGLEPWTVESEEEGGPPAIVATQTVPPMESALRTGGERTFQMNAST